MVEGAGLENRYIRKGIAGSNPALSARKFSANVLESPEMSRFISNWLTFSH